MSASHSTVFYFGDSLTDAGVLTGAYEAAFLQATGAPPPAPLPGFGPENAVSDAFTHVEYARQADGFEAVNYAVAGARGLGEQRPFEALGSSFDSNLGGQLARFRTEQAGNVPSGAAAFLLIGSNDFNAALGESLSAGGSLDVGALVGGAVETIVRLLDTLEAAARSLSSEGVETIYFGTLPPVTFFPALDGNAPEVVGLSELLLGVYNALVVDRAEALRDEGIALQIVDTAALANAITEDPTGVGILAPRSEFLNDGDAGGFDADQAGFWDGIHPSEVVQKIWGAYTAHVMQGGETEKLNDFGNLSFLGGADDLVLGLGGNDTVFAGGGDDIVFGGTGSDAIYLGRGDDLASGGSGDDRISGGWGDDVIAGHGGDDHLGGGAGDDVLIAGLGHDRLQGGWGSDAFVFTEAALIDPAAQATADIRGGWGHDTLYLVLSQPSFEAYDAGTLSLDDLGVTTRSVERVEAVNGRDGIEAALSGEGWYLEADLWSLI